MRSKQKQPIQKSLDALLGYIKDHNKKLGAGEAIVHALLPKSEVMNEVVRVSNVSDLLKDFVEEQLDKYYQQVRDLDIEPPVLTDNESFLETIRGYSGFTDKSTQPLRLTSLLYAYYFVGWSKPVLAQTYKKDGHTIDSNLRAARELLTRDLLREYPHLTTLSQSNAVVESLPKDEAHEHVTTRLVLPPPHPESADGQHDSADISNPLPQQEGKPGPSIRQSAGIMFNHSPVTIIGRQVELEPTTDNPEDDGIQVDHLPNITNELLSSFLIILIIVVSIAATMWPWPTIGILIALISYRIGSNAWRAYKNWRTLAPGHHDRWLYTAYLGYWVWVLCLALYTIAGVPYVLGTPTFWSRFAFVLQCIVVSGGIAVLSHTDMLFAIYRRAEAHKPLGLLKIGEARAYRAWKRRWTVAHYYVVIFMLLSILMLVIYLGDFIDIIVETMLF